jgi:hypothetical protein
VFSVSKPSVVLKSQLPNNEPPTGTTGKEELVSPIKLQSIVDDHMETTSEISPKQTAPDAIPISGMKTLEVTPQDSQGDTKGKRKRS